MDDTKIIQYLTLGAIATVLFIGTLLTIAIDGMN